MRVCVCVWTFAANLENLPEGCFSCLAKHTRKTMSRTQCCGWFKRFQHGRMSIAHDPKPRQPFTTADDDNFQSLCCDLRKFSLDCLRSCLQSEYNSDHAMKFFSLCWTWNRIERMPFHNRRADPQQWEKRPVGHSRKCVPWGFPQMEEMVGTVYC